MADAPILVVVGGFLGSGKTTALMRSAEHLQSEGRCVAIITNDQASGLVDTAMGRQGGAAVAEIAGGCFCCRFDALHDTLRELMASVCPDVVLAEAVGSCTDLAATVYQPLRQISPLHLRLAPLSVVVDGRRLRSLRRFHHLPRLPETVSYLYDRQMAEADLILLNKIDLLSVEERAEIERHLTATYPGVPVLPISAASGEGLDAWVARCTDDAEAGLHVLDLDYDRYAAAEACLGWLNLEGTLDTGSSPDDWARTFLAVVSAQARAANTEVAHVKVWLETPGGTARGNLVTTDEQPVVTVQGRPAGEARVLVNARVATTPELVHHWISEGLARAGAQLDRPLTTTHMQVFSPSRPVPTYRLSPVLAGPSSFIQE